jgi:hypothetical protein
MDTNYFKIEEVMTNDPELVEQAKNKELISEDEVMQQNDDESVDENLAECPSCKKNTLKIEGGCHSCVNEECGYSKCDL